MKATKNTNAGNGIGIGAALGLLFGVMSENYFGNSSKSMAIGLAIGAAM